jgi:hypothetical protein
MNKLRRHEYLPNLTRACSTPAKESFPASCERVISRLPRGRLTRRGGSPPKQDPLIDVLAVGSPSRQEIAAARGDGSKPRSAGDPGLVAEGGQGATDWSEEGSNSGFSHASDHSADTKDLISLHRPTEAFQRERTQICSFNDRLDLGEDALTNNDLA